MLFNCADLLRHFGSRPSPPDVISLRHCSANVRLQQLCRGRLQRGHMQILTLSIAYSLFFQALPLHSPFLLAPPLGSPGALRIRYPIDLQYCASSGALPSGRLPSLTLAFTTPSSFVGKPAGLRPPVFVPCRSEREREK
jgi:hypothetical protein